MEAAGTDTLLEPLAVGLTHLTYWEQ